MSPFPYEFAPLYEHTMHFKHTKPLLWTDFCVPTLLLCEYYIVQTLLEGYKGIVALSVVTKI